MSRSAAAALAALLLLGACCNPDRCYKTRTSFEGLTPVTDTLAAYQSNQGRPPETLEQAFPSGLPGNIRQADGKTASYELALPHGARQEFSYGVPWFSGTTKPSTVKALDFRYYGPGTNFCSWRTDTHVWACHGVY